MSKKVFPGMLLGSCMDFQPSEGTYAYLGKIYSNATGVVVKQTGPQE